MKDSLLNEASYTKYYMQYLDRKNDLIPLYKITNGFDNTEIEKLLNMI